MWNPGTCECQCDMWCKPGQYLDHKSCVCKNKLVDRIIAECTSVINETMMNNRDNDDNDNTITNIFIGLFSVLLFVGIVCFCVFAYFKWINGKKLFKISVCKTYKKTISIKIKDPLFIYYARSVNILDFNLEKLSIEKVHAINDELERIYYVKYNNNPFYLVINNLKGYFKYSKEKDRKELEFIIEDQSQAKIYDQIWDK